VLEENVNEPDAHLTQGAPRAVRKGRSGEGREGRTATLRRVHLGFELKEEIGQEVKGESRTEGGTIDETSIREMERGKGGKNEYEGRKGEMRGGFEGGAL